MAGSDTTAITARFLLPDYIVRAQANALSCPLWQSGALVAPTTGTCTVYDRSGVVVSTGAVAISGSIAAYTVAASSVPISLTPEAGWRVEWMLDDVLYRNTAALVVSDLHPVVTDADIYRRQSALDPSGPSPISAVTDYQSYIDEAWVTIIGRLISQGSLPYLVMEPTALREVHLTLTLALIYEDYQTRLSDAYREMGQTYRERYEAAWEGLTFSYDTDGDGDSDVTSRPAIGTIWLTGRR